jgi:hypothetical protein
VARDESAAPWEAVDRYLAEHLARGGSALEEAQAASAAAGLPPADVSPLVV